VDKCNDPICNSTQIRMLKAELKKRLIEDMIKSSRTSDEYVVLVVDPYTSKILSSACRMYDVMEAGVLVLQNINFSREKLELSAVYFIEPTRESVERLVKDFSDAKKPQYSSAHVFFTTKIEKEIMNLISNSKNLISKLKSFKELNVDFLAQESKVFSFGRVRVIPSLYFPSSNSDLTTELLTSARQLASLCLTLNEFPLIRYRSSSSICKSLAQLVEKELKAITTKISEWKPSENRDRGTLLIVDRSIDPLAPLMHEYTYQAMVNDLLNVDGELCRLEEEKKDDKKDEKKAKVAPKAKDKDKEEEDDTTVVLSEDDHLWVDFRHNHIGRVMSDITGKFREFKGSNKMAQLQSNEGASSIKEMVKAMKEMPRYKAMMRQYHKHMSLASECMAKYEKQKLHDLGELEQDIATGLTESGDKVNMKTVKTNLVNMCQNPDINLIDKLRLLMIYIIAQGSMQESTRKELMSGISIRLQKAIRNLERLGVDLSVQLAKNKSRHSKARLQEFEKRNKTIPLALMRFVPLLQSIFSNLLTGQLNEDEFAYISPPPETDTRSASSSKASRKTKSNWRGKKQEAKEEAPAEDNRSRYFCFILGGMTFSELRAAYEVAEINNSNFYLGSSSTITSRDFIRGLAELDDDDDLSDSAALDDDRKKKKPAKDEEPKDNAKDEKKGKDDKGKGKKTDDKKKKAADSDEESEDEDDKRRVKDDFNRISIKFS